MKKFKALALAIAVALTSCQNNEESASDVTTEEVEQSAVENTLENVSFKNMAGEKVALKDFSNKVIFLNFWATWCGPCIKEMPSLQAFYNKYHTNPNVEFLVVEIDNKPDLAKNFVAKNNFTFPIYSPDSQVPRELLGESIPTTVVINSKGQIVHYHEGMSDFMSDQFINKFEGILGQ